MAVMKCRALELKIHAKLIQNDVVATNIIIEVTEPGKALVHGVVIDKIERQKIIEVLDTVSDLNDAEVKIAVAPLGG